ncbi:MAG: VOC family protein [Sneathiellaceae bacterium]
MLHLRQVCLVARDLAPAEEEIAAILGLSPAYRDPAVANWGLENAVFPVGTQFLEVVAPTREGTPAGRFMDRRGGDAGYMVILQTDDQESYRARAAAQKIRTAFEFTDEPDGYSCWQLHPGDTGAAFLEIDRQRGDDPGGDWHPAGHDWRNHQRTDRVSGVTAVTLTAQDPAALAARWAAVLDRPLRDGAGGVELALDNAVLRFDAAPSDRSEDEMTGITFAASDIGAVRIAAAARDRAGTDGAVYLGGVRLEFQDAG